MKTKNESTSLISIKKKYETDSVHLLLPTVFEEQLNPFHKLSVMEVKADLSKDSGDVFKVGGQYVKTGKKVKDVNGKPKDEEVFTEYFSPAKPLLMKIATAAGIQFNPVHTGVQSIGKNTYHAKAQGAIKLPDGTYKTHYDEKIINLNDEEDKFSLEFMDKSIAGIIGKPAYEASKLFKGKWIDVDKKFGRNGETERAFVIDDTDRQKYIDRSVLVNMILLRKHAPQKAMTGAILRVVRALIGMKGQYTAEELKKPFVLARVNFSPDYTDPEVKKVMLAQGMSSMVNVFGNNPVQATNQTLFSENDATYDTAYIEDDAFLGESEQKPQDSQSPDEEAGDGENEPLPWDREFEGQETESDPNICQGCGISIPDKVSGYSINNYGIYLCMKCQKGAVRQ